MTADTTPLLSPKEVAIQWFEQVWHPTGTEAIHRFLADDAVAHLEGGLDVRGPVEFAAYREQLLAGMPDLKVSVLRAVGDETQACLHWTATGTHTGELMGCEPTNKELSFSGMSFIIVRDGVIIEGWDAWNQGNVMAALASPE